MVEIKDLAKKFDNVTVLDKVTLSFPKGSKNLIMGNSGRGKTTLLRLIAGLEAPDSGSVTADGKIAYMFQEPRLLPWKSALDNVKAFLPREKYALADKHLNSVGLADAASKYPSELSGGMAQRVAFARFLAYVEATDAKILLLDEPFSALDADTAKAMTALLLAASRDRTLILVTHDKAQADLLDGSIICI